MKALINYIEAYAIRGACTCGRCIDAPENPEIKQPMGHTANLTFFEVAAKEGADADTLRKILEADYPKALDGEEHCYLEVGADLGSQQHALMLIGLGTVLGIWDLLAPETVMPFLPDELKQQMAGTGYVTLKTRTGTQVA